MNSLDLDWNLFCMFAGACYPWGIRLQTLHSDLTSPSAQTALHRRRAKVIDVLSLPQATIILALHGLAGCALFHFSVPGLIGFFAMHLLTGGFGISLGYHRLLSHASFRAPAWLETVLAFFGVLGFQTGPLTWASLHRAHHRNEDRFGDAHSASRGFWWSHIGWTYRKRPNGFKYGNLYRRVPDLASKPALCFLERHFFMINFIAAAVAGLTLGWSFVLWAFALRIVVVWHTIWAINSVAHRPSLAEHAMGSRHGSSRNVFWLSLISYGEGLHQNHHQSTKAARFSSVAGEIDLGWWLLNLFRKLGLVALKNEGNAQASDAYLSADVRPSAAYLHIMTRLQAGDYAGAEAALAETSTAMKLRESLELRNLLSFQMGQLRTAGAANVFEDVFAYLLLRSWLFRQFAAGVLAVVRVCSILIGQRQNLQNLVLDWITPRLIPAVYFDFTKGLLQSFVASHLLFRRLDPLEYDRVVSFLGHFYNLCGRFDLGIPLLSISVDSLEAIRARAEHEDTFDAKIYDRLMTARAVYALDLTWTGRQAESLQEFNAIIEEAKRRPFLFADVFCRALRSLPCIEMLMRAELEEDAAHLKQILGNVYAFKYGLRTSANSALLLAIEGDHQSARGAIATSEDYYKHTQISVELLAFHFVTGRTMLEFGDTDAALYHIQRSKSFADVTRGSYFHKSEMLLTDAEIRLRSMIISPSSALDSNSLRQIRKNLAWIKRNVKGSQLNLIRVRISNAMLDYVERSETPSAEAIKELREGLRFISKRLERVLNLIDSTSHNSRSFQLRQSEMRTKADFSAAELLISFIGASHFDEAAADLVSRIFVSNSCRIVRKERSASHPRTGLDSIQRRGPSDYVVNIILADSALEVQIFGARRDPGFDSQTQRWLELAAAIISLEWSRRTQIQLLEVANRSVIENSSSIVDHRIRSNMEKLLANLAHDLRSPMSAIKIGLSVAGKNEVEAQIEPLDLISRGYEKIDQILNDTLKKRTNVQRLQRVEILAFLNQKFGDWATLYSPMSLRIADLDILENVNVYAIESDLDRVFTNIVKNAFEAQQLSPERTLTLKAHVMKTGYLSLTFIDGGQGISPALVDVLLQGGTTTKIHGHGLGLSGSMTLLHRSFGQLKFARSANGSGLFPVVEIPLADGAAPHARIADTIEIPENAKLVVIDDDQSFTASFRKHVEGLPITCSFVHVDAAWQPGDLPNFGENDVAVVDYNYNLPNFCGIDVIQYLLKERGMTVDRIFLCTGFWDQHRGVSAFSNTTGIRIIAKPLSVDLKIVCPERRAVDVV